jgi:hypothetical protein
MSNLTDEFDMIDWKQNPNGVPMFEVNWFVYVIGLAETSNEVLEKVSNRKDYIAVITTYLPKHVNMFRKFCLKSNATKEMKDYLRDTLKRGIQDCVEIFKEYGFSESQIYVIERNIKQIENIEF